ncbi:hypothetical protein G7061_07000 [Erysipelothrix sp. HDW6B]|uniref:hypothetical protein n=1 Tax=Erysipelothrix sp. HDW6B TaxID=2714929 RepID=UPI0014077896|nr:hypothetical protein [Erysipelothrix sp. HDW6B]QIK86370.1 hypothetical protein G7061_07000 [Erysipelothrix sp. HDW6B]
MDIITDIIRTFLWALAYAIFMIGDAIYDVTMKVATLNVGDLDIVWNYWSLLCVLIAGISMIRMLMMGIKISLDEEYREKMDIFKIAGRILMVSMAIALMPIGVRFMTNAGETFVRNIGLITGEEADTVPSTLVISSVMGDAFKVENESGGYEIPKTYKLSDISINHKETGKKEYTYFNEIGDIFILIIMGGISVVGLVLIGIEIAERYFKLGIKILISPIPISGLINPEDQSFQKWYRLVIADVVLNGLQLLSLFFILTVASSDSIRTQGVWVTLLMLIGGLFAVLKGVPELAPVIGGDTSTQGALQQMAAIRQATNGMGSFVGGAVGGALGAVGGAMATAGAGATYSLGRSLGGKSMSDIHSNNSSRSNGTNSSNNEFKSGGQDVRNSDRENVQTSSSMHLNNEELNQSDSNLNASMQQGVNADMQGNDFSNRDKSHQSFSGASEPRRYDSTEGASTSSGYNAEDLSNKKGRFAGDFTHGMKTNNEPFDKQKIRENNPNSLAKSGSFASNFVDRAYSGKGGRFGKIASTAGRHAYQSSVNRLNQTLPARASMMYLQAMNGTPGIKEGNE